MGSFSIWHWIIVLAVVLLLFGTKKLRNLGGDLGAAVRGFKKGMNEENNDPTVIDEIDNTSTQKAATSPNQPTKSG